MEPTDPVVELPRQVPQPSAWHAKQRLELVRRQLDSTNETRLGRVLKKALLERGVRHQAPERPFHVPLTHAPSQPLQQARIKPALEGPRP
jgi:hypothetical protein